MGTTEHTINDALAGILRETRAAWRSADVVASETTGRFRQTSLQPDILIVEPEASPVVIESEVEPGQTVEKDARSRIGCKLSSSGKPVLSTVAVKLPQRLRKLQGKNLKDGLLDAEDYEACLFRGESSKDVNRVPSSGWLKVDAHELSALTQSASAPPSVIDQAVERLINGVTDAAGLLDEIASTRPAITRKISNKLHQEDGKQTRRMAAAILANALVFQDTLAGGPGELEDVRPIDQLGSPGNILKSELISQWEKILEVNYWPVFDISRRILQEIPSSRSRDVLDRLHETAEYLLQSRLMRSHELMGAVFQKLIVDRKFLAAYYTTPPSASLLSNLVVTPERPVEKGQWSDENAVAQIRIADFACGTGTLLSNAYKRIRQLHEFSGGDAESLHKDMMSKSLVGLDVLPAATHLTASMLASAYPTVQFKGSSIINVSYGKQSNGEVSVGSLDLLDEQGNLGFASITSKAAQGLGEEEVEALKELPHSSFDAVIMNPPFTRATGHESDKVGVPNPMFAAFDSSEEEQKLMSEATKKLTKDTSGHGNAGEGSYFLVLADRKLKNGGMLGLVLPMSLISGSSWEKSRNKLKNKYKNLTVITISGVEEEEISFSADTSMAECLVVGQKNTSGSDRATFVILEERPSSQLLGTSIARQIRKIKSGNLRRLEGGPFGGTSIKFGDNRVGKAIDAPLPSSGGWNLGRVDDLSLAQTAYQLEQGQIWLPTMTNPHSSKVPVSTVSEVGEIGPYHMDIYANKSDGSIRGPFNLEEIRPGANPTYPVLWSHDADRERTIVFGPDRKGVRKQHSNKQEKKLIDRKVNEIWSSASHCHFNRDYRFNSQSTAMQFTPDLTIGGRAWLSIKLPGPKLEKALVLWGNTTFGLLLYWWHANKQQPGRGTIGKNALHNLSILDVSSLSGKQIDEACKIFNDVSQKSLDPLHQIDSDSVREEIDTRFAQDVLNLPSSAYGKPLDLLRSKLGAEPTVRGGK